MDTNLTDEERLDLIKKWWRENGSSIITGVVLGLAVLFGGKAWFSYQETNAQTASNIYVTLMSALETGDALAVAEKTGVLVSEYGGTPYATLAALAMAKIKIEAGELNDAQAQLRWVLDNSKSEIFRDTARLRLARVLIAMEDLDAAEALLQEPVSGNAFDPLYTEVKGDVNIARGDIPAAHLAYQEALAATAADSPGRYILELKYQGTQQASIVPGEQQE
jgi:predicted negative regulator of RcsB-dependent stress response